MARTTKAKVVIEAEDRASAPIKKAKGSFESLEKTLGGTGASVGGVQKSFRSFTNYLANSFVITAGDVFRAVGASFRILQDTLNLKAQAATLRTQLSDIEGGFDGFLSKLEEVSNGTVATNDLIASSSRALLLGIPAEEISSLLEISRVSAAATGEAVAKSFDDITKGIGRQSPLILDNLGIIVNVTDANKKYAEALNKNATELTKTEQSQAFLNSVLEVGQRRVEEFDGALGGLNESLQQSQASIKNYISQVQGIGVAYGEGLQSAVTFTKSQGKVNDLLEDAAEVSQGAGAAFGVYLTNILKGAGPISALAGVIDDASDSIIRQEAATEAAARASERLANANRVAREERERHTAAVTAGNAEHERLVETILAQERALLSAIDATSSLGEVTSLQLGEKIKDIQEELRKQSLILGENSAEYRRLEEIGVSKMESLRAQADRLSRGMSAVSESVEGTTDSISRQGRVISETADLLGDYYDSVEDATEGIRNQGDATVSTSSQVENYADSVSRAGSTLVLMRENIGSVTSALSQAGQQAVSASAQFDALEASAGRLVAVNAALQAGGSLSLGGTRINLPGGGSRLTSTPGLTGRTSPRLTGGLSDRGGSTFENTLRQSYTTIRYR